MLIIKKNEGLAEGLKAFFDPEKAYIRGVSFIIWTYSEPQFDNPFNPFGLR